MVALNFNATGTKPNTALEPLPSGQYPVTITASEEKPTKAGNGSYLQLEMTVAQGEFAGRKIFDRLNLRNPNQIAVDIAYATLSAICHVTGRMQIQDSQQLHGAPFIAVVNKVARDDRPGEFSNEIKGYKDMQGNDPGHAGAVSNPSAQPNWAAGQAQQQQPVQQQPQGAFGQQPQQNNPQTQQQQPVQQQQPAQQGGGQPSWAAGNGQAAAGPAGAAGGPPSWAQQ